ncbi:MAG: RNA polymerase sigma factor [Candidatus Doudnabacteria bacterium]
MAKRFVQLQDFRAKVEEPSDAELVRRYGQGDESAFNTLYYRHTHNLTKAAMIVLHGDRDMVEEMVEACWLKVLRSLDTFKGSGTFKAWVTRILHNLIKDQYKRGHYKYCETFPPEFEFEEWCPQHHTLDPLEQLILKEEMALIMARLGSLPDGIRRTFVIVHLEGHSYDEAASLLRINIGALKMRLVRARRALREVITE